jgi:hypothetical protein
VIGSGIGGGAVAELLQPSGNYDLDLFKKMNFITGYAR